MNKNRHHNRVHCRGFTLAELAIVLLIASVLLGAVWIAAQSTWDNYRVYRTNQLMAKTTQNIREYYMSASTLPAGNITATLDGLQLFPVEMRRNQSAAFGASPVDNPFNANWANGSFQVQNIACPAGTAVCFRVQMLGLTQGPCIKLLTYVPINDADLGIVRVGTPNTGFSLQNSAVMVTPTQAQQWCQQGVNNNEIDWDFKLRN